MAAPSTTQAPVHSSTYSLECDRVFAINPGFLAPVYTMATIPGDSLGISSTVAIDTLPAITPAYTRFRAQLRYFWTDIRAYLPELAADIVSLHAEKVQLPIAPVPAVQAIPLSGGSSGTHFNADISTYAVAPNSLLNFLYYPAGTVVPYNSSSVASDTDFYEALLASFEPYAQSLLPFMTYVHTYYRYYMNPQEPQYAFYARSSGSDGTPLVYTYSGNILAQILSNGLRGFHYQSAGNAPQSAPVWGPASAAITYGNMLPLYPRGFGTPYGGLAILPYLPSVNESWINPSSVQTINAMTQLDLTTSLSINDILAKDKLRKYLSLGLFGASGYLSWVYSQFAVHPVRGFASPQYLGGSEFLVSFSDVLGTSADNLGERGGQGNGRGSTPYRRYALDSYGIFQVMFDIRPILNYSQGMDEQFTFSKLSDLPSYEMSSIPWEPLRRRTLCCLPSVYAQSSGPSYVTGFYKGQQLSDSSLRGTLFDSDVVGYRTAWTPYRSAYNRAIGYFEPGQDLDAWTTNRKYLYRTSTTTDTTTLDVSTYINSGGVNDVFVDQDPQASNFMVYIRLNIDLRRNLNSNAVPTF